VADAKDVISDFAARVGIDPQQAREGLAAILQAIQQAVSPETFDKIVQGIPHGPELVEQAKQRGSSLFGAMADMAGQMAGMLGAGERSQVLANVVTRLSELGLNGEQLQKFITQSVEFFRQHLPADLVQQVSNFLQGDKSAKKG
jgi:hypothetical protein